MQRRRYSRDADYDKTDYPSRDSRRKSLSTQNRENWEEGDASDFETYAYEYKTKSYTRIKSPKTAGGYQPKHRPSSPSKHYSPEERIIPHRRDTLRDAGRSNFGDADRYRDTGRRLSQKASKHLSDREKEKILLNLAATKIQAAYRGYRTRKMFWRERELFRMQDLSDKPHYRQDFILSSMTSIVDSSSFSSIAASGDPNLGLTKKLKPIDTSQRIQILKGLKSKMHLSDEIPTANQLQTASSPTILVLGGINPEEADDFFLGSNMFVYNIQKDRWLYASTMPEPRNYHGAVYLNGKVYVIGGFNPLEVGQHGQMLATQSTYQLTIRSRRWRRRADMHQARAFHGTCVIEENIMVMGGRDMTGKLLSGVEVYYPKRDQWALAKPMPEAIMGMATAVMDGSVWVVGGITYEINSSKYCVSDRVYAFDIQQQSWFLKPSLPEPRAYGNSASLKREIWLWCGVKEALNEDGYLMSSNSVYVFNPEINKWEQHASIGTPKHGAAVTKFGRRVFLIAGMSNVSGSKEVLNENDCYNRELDRYTEGAPLPRLVTGAAAVALPIDYIASSDPKWNLDNVNDEILNEAATKIQAVFRGYRTRSLLSHSRFPISRSTSEELHRRALFAPVSHAYQDKWKLFQRVQIDDWPPVPDPKSIPSELNIRLGTLPKGYTISAANQTGRTKVRRYVQLPEHADPNLGMCGHICNIYKQTKKLLGLRKVEHLPSFARDMLTVTTLQDDSLPVVLVMGGLQPKEPVNLSYGKLIMRYSPLKDRWEYFGVLPEPRNFHAAIYYHQFIYVTGGCDPDRRNSGEMVATSTTYCLNIHSSEWIQRADMNCNRSHHCLVAYRDRLYAIGGRDHNGRLVASIECYDIENDKWSLKHAMSHPRMGMACVVYQDQIWCMGGVGLSDDVDYLSYPILSSVISYDVSKDVWISRPPLRCPRAYATCVLVQKKMWLIGGASKDRACNCLISMASVDTYLPEDAVWIRKTLLNVPRHSAAIVSVETCVYIFGGVSSQEWSALSKNEMVVINDVSLHVCSSLPLPLTGLAAVAVPPVSPSLRSESVALLLHAQLTFH